MMTARRLIRFRSKGVRLYWTVTTAPPREVKKQSGLLYS